MYRCILFKANKYYKRQTKYKRYLIRLLTIGFDKKPTFDINRKNNTFIYIKILYCN